MDRAPGVEQLQDVGASADGAVVTLPLPARAVHLEIGNRRGGALVEVELRGELDAYTLPAFEARMTNLAAVRQPSKLCFEMSQVPFAGIRALDAFLRIDAILATFGGELVVVNPSRGLSHILRACDAASSLVIEEPRRAAAAG